MKTKAGYSQDLIAKIDYMQSIDVDLSISDSLFLDTMKAKLEVQPDVLSVRERERLEHIFEMDATRRVYRITLNDQSFARGLIGVMETVTAPPTTKSVDPFADIGRSVNPPTPKLPGRKARRKKRQQVSLAVGKP